MLSTGYGRLENNGKIRNIIFKYFLFQIDNLFLKFPCISSQKKNNNLTHF